MSVESLTPQQKAFLEAYVLDAPLAAPRTLDQRQVDLVKGVLKQLAALPPDAARLVSAQTRQLAEALRSVSAQAAAGKADKAEKLLDGAATRARKLARDLPLIGLYAVEAQKFAQRLKEARSRIGGKGGIAIEDYIDQLEQDNDRRIAAEEKGNFRRALNAVEARDNVHEAKMQDADRGKVYVTIEKALEAEIARLEKLGPQTDEVIAKTRTVMDMAENLTHSSNWVGAELLMRKAEKTLRMESAGADLAQKIVADTGDFQERQRKCIKLIAGFMDLPGASFVADQLQDCMRKAHEARSALPDEAKANKIIAEVQQQCADLVDRMTEAARYAEFAEAAMDFLDEVDKQNLDRCILKEIKEAREVLSGSADLARDGQFAKAERELDRMGDILNIASEAADIYVTSVKPGRDALAGAVKSLGSSSTHTPHLVKLFNDMSWAFIERDFARAAELAEEGQRRAEMFPPPDPDEEKKKKKKGKKKKLTAKEKREQRKAERAEKKKKKK